MKSPLFVCVLLPFFASVLAAETLISWKKQVLETKFYAEGATFGDINGDGKNDIVYGPFWFEGPAFTKRHTFYEPKEYNIVGYSDNFFAYVRDLNGDGSNDILIVGFPGKEARVYLNPGKDVANYPNWPVHVVADVVDDESPEFTDLTGDGKPELVCAHGGQFGYFAPDWNDVTKPWKWRPISENVGTQRFTHGLGIGDVNGDGKMDILEAKRWWEAPPAAENTKDKSQNTNWKSHPFPLGGNGGAQMFAYDFNGDDRPDMVSSLNAHGFGLAWFEQGTPALLSAQDAPDGKSAVVPGWQKHLIVGQEPWENEYGVRFSQPHAVALADVDGDGIKDIITGNRYFAHNGHGPNELDPRVLYWFQAKRHVLGAASLRSGDKLGQAAPDTNVEFIPHLIDGDTGVGTQLVAGDIDGDGLLDVVIGNKYGCRVLLQRREEASPERYTQFQPKKIYGPESMQPNEYKSGQPAADAVKNMILPAGFKAELIAAEPDIVQPIAMCWDERGRLWVAEGNSYPQKRKGDKGPDRILIFEDTKGTGKFDKRTVFMDGLNLVSGMEVGFGGVWVGAAPQLLFIPKDANDKPGEPKVLLDGWGMQDTHETLNSFIWGPDGWLYGCHGVFTHSRIGKPGTPDDLRTPMNAGVWRYHPVRHEFEVFAHGTSNPWGLDYDEHGEFFVTSCVIPHMFHIVPGARYFRQGGQHFNPYTYDDIKTIADHAHYAGNIADNAHWGPRHTQVNVPVADDTNQAGGGHAHCGLCIYQGDNFPPEYRGEFIFGNLHGHRLVHDHLDPNGSSFTDQHRADFMRSDDHWFIPIQQKVGPDGALYVSDWSDKQVCHQGSGAVDMWDRSNGRIYRIVYDKVDAKAPFDLGKMSDLELARLAVEGENVWFERMARRVLMERTASHDLNLNGPHVLRFKLGTEDALSELRRGWLIHALSHDYESIKGEPINRLAERILHADPSVRAWSIRLFGQKPHHLTAGDFEKVFRQFSDEMIDVGFPKLARNDKSPVVRRELASLLQRLPLDKRVDIALGLLSHKEDEKDPNIPLLVWYGIEPLVGSDPKTGLKLANACKWERITGFIYRRMSSDDKGRNELLALTAEMNDAAQREKTLAMLVDSARNTGRHEMPKGWPATAAKLRAPTTNELVDEMSAIFGDEAVIQKYRGQLKTGKSSEHSLAVLLQVHDLPTTNILQELITTETNATPMRRKAIQALVSLPDPGNVTVLLGAYARLTPDEKSDAVSALASTREGATALLKGVEDKKIESQMLSPFLVRQLQTLKDKDVDQLITKVWGTVNQAKPDIAQQKAKWRKMLAPGILKAADGEKGRELFKGTCATCHKLFGEGFNVGPDLTGSNRANLDYVLDNVLDPSAVIGKGYELNVFTMKDARVLSGIMKEESNTGYKLAMPGGVELVLNKTEVSKREILKMSMMPEGQFDALGPGAAAQLVAYLQLNSSPPGPKRDPKNKLSANAQLNFKVEGAIEGESMKILGKTGGNPHGQKMGGFRAGKWSGNNQVFWTGAKAGDVLSFALPVAEKAQYLIKGVLTKARDYGTVTISLDGEPLNGGAPFNLYDPNVITTGEIGWGVRDLEAGEHKLEVKIQSADPKSSGLLFGLDYVKLEKR